MQPEFWRGKRVLVTGHTGFKGAWLSLWLEALGAEVTGLALAPPTTPNLFEAAAVTQGLHSVMGDIRDAATVAQVMAQAAPEVVLHLAAQPLVRYSYSHPVETYHTNVMGTVHVLEAIRQTPSVRAAVIVTSDKCYENREWDWGYRENDRMGGHDPYSNSKGCVELVTAAFRSSYFSRPEATAAIATARAGNVIGGGDWAEDRLIPDMLRAIVAGQAVQVRSPQAIRPWQHVLEPLSGYLLLAQRLYETGALYAEGWNFGPAEQDAYPVASVVAQLIQLWGDSASWVQDSAPQPHEAHYLRLDCAKARQRLGWQPQWGLPTALAQVVAWHKAYCAGADMRQITLQQIHEYTAALLNRDGHA